MKAIKKPSEEVKEAEASINEALDKLELLVRYFRMRRSRFWRRFR